MVVGKHEIQTLEIRSCFVLAFVDVFDVFVSKSAHPLLLLNKSSIQTYLNVI